MKDISKKLFRNTERDYALTCAKGVGVENDLPCRHFAAYLAIYPPKCKCVPCNVAYQIMQTFDDEDRAARQAASA